MTRFDDAQACDTERYGALFRHLLAHGVYVAPSQFEAMFVSTAHGDAEIERTVEAVAGFFGLTLWEVIADEAAAESPLWGEALLAAGEREPVAVFSPLLADPRYAVGLETIYEGYLLHYGRPRLFAAGDGTTRCCSATTSTRTGSSASPSTRTSRRSPTSRR